jgi:hypothetical protein
MMMISKAKIGIRGTYKEQIVSAWSLFLLIILLSLMRRINRRSSWMEKAKWKKGCNRNDNYAKYIL